MNKRFWSKVDKHDHNGCWLWTAYCNSEGYGRVLYRGNRKMAHRVSWELTNGPIPDHMLVLHECDTPPCVNPSHLFLGTHIDNMRDMAQKGRAPGNPSNAGKSMNVGETHGLSKLTAHEVSNIRELLSKGHTGVELSRLYSISQATITYIKQRKIWAHI